MRIVNRRGFLKGSAAGAASIPFLSSRADAAHDRPNVILITADDLGWRELGCYGNPHIKTPNLDRLAAGGVRFTNAFVTAPSCSASRSSMITGQAPHSVHVLGLTHRHTRFQMSPEIPTLARSLRDAGYRTAIQGKWHVSTYRDTRRFGYDKRMSIMSIRDSKKARRFISANQSRPFYLELNYIQTHRPGGDHYFRMVPEFPVDPGSIRVPEYWRVPDWPEIREDVAAYYSQAAEMDRLIGEVLDHLDALGLAERTMVVFVSDNGPPYPGCKTTCFDPGIGTPLILRWPDGIPAQKTFHGLASTIDIMPTCLEAAGVACPPEVQGSSLLPMARGERREVHDAVFSEVTFHVLYTPMRAVRTHEYKYIENLSPDPTGLDQCEDMPWARRAAREPGQRCCVLRPPEELFNIKDDPHERRNLANDPAYLTVKNDLRERLHKWRRETRDPFPDLS
jgi:N-sulfoglucosamine sulfohydrolase